MFDQAEKLRKLTRRSSNNVRLRHLLKKEDNVQKTGCTTISVTSGKGGVGKTNISINLAILLAKANKKVILFDADLGLANVNILLGLNPALTLENVVNGEKQIEDVLLDGPFGIKIVPSGGGLEEMANIDSVSLMKLIRSLEVLENSCDYLIFDTQAGISNCVSSFVNASDIRFVVVTPDPSSLADAYAAVKMIVKTGVKNIGIITNMVKDEKEGLETYKKLSLLTERFLSESPLYMGCLQFDNSLRAGVRQQSPVSISYPNSPFSKNLNNIARQLVGKKRVTKRGFFKRFFNLV